MRQFLSLLFLLAAIRAEALVDLLALSGDPAPMTISTATAGSDPDPAVDSSTSYGLTTVALATRRITGQIGSALPAGLSLAAELEAPPGATSQGQQTLSTTPVNLVTGIFDITLLLSGFDITYTLSATAQAAPTVGQNIVVTLTLTP